MRARRLSAVPAAVLLFLSVACQRDPVAVATPLTVRPPDAETRATNQAISQGSIIDLGTLGGRYSEAKAVNASGDVVGSAGLPGPVDVRRAFLWRNGVMTNLGTLGIGRNTVANYSFAFGINDAGQIVGESTTPLTYYHHAVVWWNGSIIDLGAKGPSSYSSAYAINNAGDAVGSGDVASGANHALLWRGGQIIDLFTLGGSTSNAYGINNAGQVVGASTTTGDLATHAFLWQSGVMTDLGTLGGLSSYANGINDAGQVVGYSYTTAGTAHAFRWDATSGMTDLGAISGQTISQAFGVSPTGMIVGQSFSNGVPTRAVVWEADVISILDNLSNATSSSANARSVTAVKRPPCGRTALRMRARK